MDRPSLVDVSSICFLRYADLRESECKRLYKYDIELGDAYPKPLAANQS